FAQMHAPFFVELAEPGISKIFDEADGLSRTFHFRPQFFVHMREFIEAEHRLFDREPFKVFLHFVIGEFFLPNHDFGGYIEIGYPVSLGNERGSPGGPGIGFDYVYLSIFDGELDVYRSLHIQMESDPAADINHFVDFQLAQVEGGQQGMAIPAVYAGGFNMFHDSHDMDLFPVAYGVNFGFLATVQEVVYENLVSRKVFDQAEYAFLQ